MLMVMRQKRQAEEDERRAKEEREARAAWLKVRQGSTRASTWEAERDGGGGVVAVGIVAVEG